PPGARFIRLRHVPLLKYKEIFIFVRLMSMDTTLLALRAVAESTRLRLLALLSGGEVSVGELVIVLRQSQPRVSRHLKLLVEAEVVERFRDRHHVYYRLTRMPELRSFVDQVLASLKNDSEIATDRLRLDEIKFGREKIAYAQIGEAQSWADTFRQRPDESDIHDAFDDALSGTELGDLLDVRTGTGALLGYLAPHASSATGVDRSDATRLLARSRLQQAGLADCTLRNVEGKCLPFAESSFDTVLLNEAMSHATDQMSALGEAVRVLRRNGQLLILDWIAPVSLQNRGGRELSENQVRALLAEHGLEIVQRAWLPGKSPDYALFKAVPAKAQRTGTMH
ncbi:MAG: ArsR/SmtB family transcription factor, partial [Gammaproteobacteria bacterium]